MPSDPDAPEPEPDHDPDPEPDATDDATATPADDAVAPNALPARSMLSGVNVRGALSALVPLAIAGAEAGRWLIAILVVGAVIAGVARLVHWRRFRWGFDGQVLHVHSGLFWRQRRALDIGRIQQVELQRPVLHRVLGTALMRVETASDSGDTEVSLNGLEVEQAESLRDEIATARRQRANGSEAAAATGFTETSVGSGGPAGPASPEGPDATPARAVPPPPVVSLIKPSVADLVRHAVTGSGLLVVPAALAALSQFVFEFAGDQADDLASDAASSAAGIGLVALALGFLVIGLAGAVIMTLLRDWDLELVRDGDDLRLSRGLLEQRSATVPVRRLQVLEYRQNWLRSLFGVGTLQLRSAGGSNADQDRRIIVPWVDRSELDRVLAVGLHDTSAGNLPPEPQRHPAMARRRLGWLWLRGLWIPLTILAIPVAILTVTPMELFGDDVGLVSGLLAGAYVATGLVGWLLSRAQYRRLGHAATDRVALVTGGVLGHTSTWMPLGRLQGVTSRANPFQRRLDLVTLVLAPAGAGNQPVDIRDVSASRGDELGNHLLAIAAGRVGPVAPVGASTST